MKISDFVRTIDNHVQSVGYKLWFGTRDSYNSKRVITDREVILEPFDWALSVPTGQCFIDFTITLWIGVRRNIDEGFMTQESGQALGFVDHLKDEATKIFDLISSDSTILIPKNRFDIKIKYYEADSGTTVNTQAFVKMTLPIRYHGKSS